MLRNGDFQQQLLMKTNPRYTSKRRASAYQASFVKISITIINNSDRDLTLLWMDNGQFQWGGSVLQGLSFEQRGFLGVRLVVKDGQDTVWDRTLGERGWNGRFSFTKKIDQSDLGEINNAANADIKK